MSSEPAVSKRLTIRKQEGVQGGVYLRDKNDVAQPVPAKKREVLFTSINGWESTNNQSFMDHEID